MNGGLSLAIPCRADEPGLGATLTSLAVACRHTALADGLIRELVICLNGLKRGTSCASLLAARAFCAKVGIPLQEIWLMDEPELLHARSAQPADAISETREQRMEIRRLPTEMAHSPIPVCTILLTERKGKPPAWNTLWRYAVGTLILFCDADVRVDPEAVWFLYDRVRQDPHLSLVAAREVPVLEGKGTLWSRMGALPYRFNFGNAGGRLFLFRKDALLDGMPEDLLLEDAWLTVAVGKQRVAKDWRAQVYFLPPATGRDYFAERVRTEGGKIQIRRVHGKFLQAGPIATYPWGQLFSAIAVREYPLVLLALLVRGVARVWARLALVNKEFYALYRPFLTTKDWSGA
jgi:glycosyltransferase involved in cell wall biosynthesis